MTKIRNRKTNELLENKNPKGSYFLYNNFFGRLILKLVNKRFLSVLVGKYLDSKFSKGLIKNFIKNNSIDMSPYEKKTFQSFNEFFSRKIKNGERNFSKDKRELCSPADSKLTVFKVDRTSKFTIKNKEYNLVNILRNKELAREYENGYMLVFRLGVDDYHRYSYVDTGKIISKKKIKGIYNTVGPIAFERFKVFEENVREYEVLDTFHFDQVIQMEVGAIFVGKIKNYHRARFTRGEEKGYFQFGGSTIIMFFKENTIKIDKDILNNSKSNIETRVLMGEKIGDSYESF